MSQVRARFAGSGIAVPPRVVHNTTLSRVMETNDDWIRERSGVVERRYVERVLMLKRNGERIVRTPSDFAVGYRHVGLKEASDEIFAAAWFRFPPGDPEVARGRMRELLERRVATQPLALPNAGSVFRNPPGDHAARLIEAAGLKGARIGGAQVSEKHSNFIVNPEGEASASAIEMLIGRVQAEVREKFGISLLREVRIVGVAEQEWEGA